MVSFRHWHVLSVLRYPILRSLPVFLIGQVLEWYCGAWVGVLSILLFFVPPGFLGLKGRSTLVVFLLSFNLGVISATNAKSLIESVELSAAESYLATVDEIPRHPKVGQIRLSLALEKLARKGGHSVGSSQSLRGRVLCRAVDLPWRNPSSITLGDRIIFQAKWSPIAESLNPFSYESSLRRHGYIATCSISYSSKAVTNESTVLMSVQRLVRQYVFDINGANEGSSLFLSMGLGARDVLSTATERAFKNTGLSHLLVLSGYQVTLIYGSIYFLLLTSLKALYPALLRSGNLGGLCSILSLMLATAFTYFTGWEASSVRALLAITTMTVLQWGNRNSTYWHGVLAALWGVNLIWPLAVFDVGTQLTFAALVGIGMASCITREGTMSNFLAVSILASLMTALVSLVWFGAFSPIGLVINPILAPLLSWLSCNCGFVTLFLHVVSIDGRGVFFRATVYLLELSRDCVVWLAEFPFAYVEIESRSLCFVFSGAILSGLLWFVRRYRVGASLLDRR